MNNPENTPGGRGFAFATFTTPEPAQKLLQMDHGHAWDRCRLFNRPSCERSGSPHCISSALRVHAKGTLLCKPAQKQTPIRVEASGQLSESLHSSTSQRLHMLSPVAVLARTAHNAAIPARSRRTPPAPVALVVRGRPRRVWCGWAVLASVAATRSSALARSRSRARGRAQGRARVWMRARSCARGVETGHVLARLLRPAAGRRPPARALHASSA